MEMTYLQLLTKIENKQINPYNYYMITKSDEIFHFNGFEFVNNDEIKFVNKYIKSDAEIMHFVIKLEKKPKDIKQNKVKVIRKAKGDIIHELWDMYLSLDWDIDTCQGCIDDLDKQFEKVNIYKRLLEYMGVPVDMERDKKFKKWYSEQIQKQKEEQKQLEGQLKPLGINWIDLARYEDTEIKPILDLYKELAFRLNDVLTYLRNKETEKEKN